MSFPAREDALREVVRGRLEAVGPTTVGELASALALCPSDVEVALAMLETEGFVLRGRYRPEARAGASESLEWCERRLLARIHRATLERLRSEIEPVSPAVLMRFFVEHQSASAGEAKRGLEGLYAVVEQLGGLDLAAAAWERDVLPRRIADYDPQLLDMLSFTGRIAWARAAESGDRRVQGPIRTTPIALFPREQLAVLRSAPPDALTLSLSAEKVRAHLAERGASFVADIARERALDRAQVEQALGELAAQGLVTSDGFLGLRALLGELRARSRGAEPGRYALLEAGTIVPELAARCLLRRWGVVFRKLLDRESLPLSWHQLVRALRELEARGEVRGGRFIANFAGEQFALPEVVSRLRRLRREPARGELVSICASDPLNLVGIITPGPRIPQLPSSRILLRDGVPVAALLGGSCRWLADIPEAEQPALELALRTTPRRFPASDLGLQALPFAVEV